jgi:hypothetical protein
MLCTGSIVISAATGLGFMAASIAVGGFLGHIYPLIREKGDRAVALATVIGGIGGLLGSMFTIALGELVA